MPADPNRVESLFHRARGLLPADRAAFLAATCGGDAELRDRVERLLAAADSLGEPETSAHSVEPPTGTFDDPSATADHTPQPDAGTVLGGRYKLAEEIGEGGMGAVWMAQQTEPVKRAVAVKVIKAGMDSKAVLARFEAERQALAMMDHPNIARVLDAGAAPDGRPFFVMELVKGDPITKYCDDRKLTPRQRLELFVPVCHAIQHAHMKGVIHRDIKPSNVLVAMYDDKPVPKVIDFGVAKATGPTLTDRTLMTGFGAVVGTPEYMSPEQANLNNLDIDTRSDVYSLGVLLYELLTGTTPVDRKSLGQAALLEVLRIVREVEAPRPSGKLSSATTPPSVAANRGTEPAKLSKLMKGELDWVVLKALEKDRARRYESANGLARDIQRYLADEVVEARPPSVGYRLRKFVRRHKGQVAATAAFLALLVVSVAVSSWWAVKATRAEGMAEAKRGEAETNAKEAKDNADAFWKVSEANVFGRVETEIRSLSLQTDLDLAEYRTDAQVGLLRLARPMPDSVGPVVTVLPGANTEMKTTISMQDRPAYRELRQFVTATVLVAGQDYAPLLPPLTHDGSAVWSCQLSPDAKAVMTHGYDGTVRLWDSATAKHLATLRERDERVIICGFSPEGSTAVTDDMTGVARFWDAATGKLRAKTSARPERYGHPPGWAYERIASPILGTQHTGSAFAPDFYTHYADEIVQIEANRLLTGRIVLSSVPGGYSNIDSTGPAELWDVATGALVARFDAAPGKLSPYPFRLVAGGRYVAVLDGLTSVRIHSAEDGRLLTRLTHDGQVRNVFASPSGRRLAMLGANPQSEAQIRAWDTATWREDPAARTDVGNVREGWVVCVMLSDDSVAVRWLDEGVGGTTVYRLGEGSSAGAYNSSVTARSGPDLAWLEDGRLFDAVTWKRLVPPAGRKYHPDLAHFAGDQRFAVSPHFSQVIDTRTDKVCSSGPWQHRRAFGLVRSVVKSASEGGQVHVIPTAHLDIPPALLQLWAQVAVRGELGPDGEFVPWNEATWDKKRQELAAIPPPHPDFPFPGYVATDKLHWLRAEYEAAAEKDKPRLAADLLRRSEASGDKAAAVRWRAEWNRLNPEVAPLPRAVVK